MQSCFRANFNNKIVENNIFEFEYWKEIQGEDVDTAFEVYQKGSYIQKWFPGETAMIFKLIEQGGLLGVIAEAHEKWEVLEYLKRGYLLEDIGNGKTYIEYKPLAHAEARYKECRLYQFWYKQLYNENAPAMRAFWFVHPIIKIILQDIFKITVTVEVMNELMNELLRYEGIMRSEQCSKEHIIKCIRFFELTGYDYEAQRDLFLNRGLTFLEKIG